MTELRITKYDPQNRNEFGHYKLLDEWTEFSDVGDRVSLEDYERVEAAYCSAAFELLRSAEVDSLAVSSLQSFANKSPYREGEDVPLHEVKSAVQSLLRGEYWCKLSTEGAFIHIGWDFYMYVGIPFANESVINAIERSGLYVESFESPYGDDDS